MRIQCKSSARAAFNCVMPLHVPYPISLLTESVGTLSAPRRAAQSEKQNLSKANRFAALGNVNARPNGAQRLVSRENIYGLSSHNLVAYMTEILSSANRYVLCKLIGGSETMHRICSAKKIIMKIIDWLFSLCIFERLTCEKIRNETKARTFAREQTRYVACAIESRTYGQSQASCRLAAVRREKVAAEREWKSVEPSKNQFRGAFVQRRQRETQRPTSNEGEKIYKERWNWMHIIIFFSLFYFM